MSKNDKQNKGRRALIKHGALAAGGVAAFAAGYGETLVKTATGLVRGTAGTPSKDAVVGNARIPEFALNPVTGALETHAGQVVSPSLCLGCWTQCGVRVRVDQEKNEIIRIAGNPYHPLATTAPAPMTESVREVYSRLGLEHGLEGRATACARGNAMQEQVNSPYRVLSPLKRVGKRGEGRWEKISFEQLIEEVCNGGDLFGEGHVEGLGAIFDRETLIDPENPEFGPLSNQLIVTDAGNEGRTPLLRRFAEQSFGTVNRSNHGAYCGQSFRIGAGVALGDVRSMPHGKPDWSNARFGLFIGAAPAQSGNPFQRQGRELAEARARTTNPFSYVVVSPILPTSSSLAAGTQNRWLAVRPATDLALCLALIRWILENHRYDTEALSLPSIEAMEAAGEASWTNATHLLINDPNHPRYGSFLRGSDLGWAPQVKAEGDTDEEVDVYVVQRADGSLAPHTITDAAELFVERTIDAPELGTSPIAVCSALSKLQAEVQSHSYEEYSDICGVSVKDIQDLAQEFTAYGRQAVADAHGGTMSGSGFYTAYAIGMLNTLVGNLNVKGGLVLDAGPFGPFGPGPRYDFRFPGQKAPQGLALSRTRMPYEKSSEYKQRVAAGEDPYPTKAPWYPIVGGLSTEMVAAGIAGYPYKAKAWINHMGNPMYGIAGLRNTLYEDLCDPKKLPLIICIDPFINETTALADYIVPDTVTYESWGTSAPWADVIAKTSTLRWPIVKPKVEHYGNGEAICAEAFFIEVAKKIGMPGFGDDAIGSPQSDERYPIHTAKDFYLRGFANVAFAQGRPVADATQEDMQLTGVDKMLPILQEHLKAEEQPKVALLMTRGGRFDRIDDAWEGNQLKHAHRAMLPIWDEELATTTYSMTGERLAGCPTWYPTRMADGTPMRDLYPEQDWPFLLSSYKSNIMSSITIAVDRLRQVHPHNPVSIHPDDAQKMGIRNGDKVRIVTPGNAVEAVAMLRDGVMRGAIAIEHGYGHRELGARTHYINGQPMAHNKAIAAGINLNDLGFQDPTRADKNVWIDWVSGAAVRQGLPARLERISA